MLAISTGNESIDWTISIFSVIFGPPLALAAWSHIKKVGKNFRSIYEKIDQNAQDNKKNSEDIKALREEYATAISVILGFIDLGEEAYIVADASNGRTLYITPIACKMLRLDPNEVINGAWKDIIHGEDSARVREQWETFVRSRLAKAKIRFRFDRPGSITGSSPIISVELVLLRKRIAGGAERIVGVFRQLTPVPPTAQMPALPDSSSESLKPPQP